MMVGLLVRLACLLWIAFDIHINPFPTIADCFGDACTNTAYLCCFTIRLAMEIFVTPNGIGIPHILVVIHEVACSI